jgi:RNA recognition motif-containing protein
MTANGRKLFLGGLTKTTTTEQLFEIFGKFGTVVDAVVMERNGNPRGFGFVTFKEKSSLEGVLAEGVTIDGREVDIKRAVPEEEMAVASSKVFVGGLPQTVDKQALQEHFEQVGEVRDAVVMVDRATGRSRGFGFVRFNSPDAVERVLASPQELGGQPVDVKRAEPADNMPPAQPARAKDDVKGRRRRRGKKADDEAPYATEAAASTAFGGFDPQTAAAAAAQLNLAMSFLSLTQQAMMGNQAGLPPSFPLGTPNQQQLASIFAATATAQANAAMTASAPSGAAEFSAHPDLSTLPFRKQTEPVPLGDLSNVLNGQRPTSSEKARWGPPLPLAKTAGQSTLGSSQGLALSSSALAGKSIW